MHCGHAYRMHLRCVHKGLPVSVYTVVCFFVFFLFFFSFFSAISDVSKGAKDKALHFQWYYASTESQYGRNLLLPRDYSVMLTAWSHGGRNQRKQLWWQQCWLFDLLLTETEFESVCMHAGRQLKSDTPASKYDKSFAIMCAFLVWDQQDISQL